MFVPGWMWHTMHWLVGIERVNSCLMGWPDSFLRNGRIDLRAVRLVAVRRVRAGVNRRPIVGVNHVARRAAAAADNRRDDRWCRAARAADPAGASSASPRNTGSVRSWCRGRDRSACRRAAPDLLPDSDCRSRTALRRRARTRAEYCRAAKLPSAPADRGAAARPWSRVSSCDWRRQVFDALRQSRRANSSRRSARPYTETPPLL